MTAAVSESLTPAAREQSFFLSAATGRTARLGFPPDMILQAAFTRRRSHGRIGVAATEREQAVGCACDVEVEREMLVDGEHVAQMPLQRIAGVEALRPVARPQRLHRLARLVHGESGMRAEAQLGLE